MKNPNRTRYLLIQSALTVLVIIISGLCWYFSVGFSGDYWYLVWLAPIPVLVYSLKVKGKMAFIVSFFAYLIGKLSWFSQLIIVAPLVVVVILTLSIPLIFALIVILTRRTVLNTHSWYSIFVFPVFYTVFEFLLINLSSDGTATSIAYSQLNVLPIIQIASITGILGITFLVTYIPSSIAVGWHYRKEKKKVLCIMGVTIVILISVFLFGMIRINGTSDKNTTNAGLVVLEERLHNITQHPDFEKEKMVAEYYAKEISDLALKGVQLVVLPERAINITKETENDIIGILSNTAKQNNVFIILGYTNFRNPKKYNSALVITSEGSVATDYNKVHLLKGFEDRIFTKGSDIGLFKFHRIQAGVAICKDLDFPDYIRNFGVSKVSFLVTPAWDFVKDDWLHSRMAVLRCVENGFSMIRTARLGRLTINDYCGRVTSEAKSSDGNKTTLTGKVLLERINTLYVRFGDWFVIVIAFAAIGFVFQGILRRRNNKQVKHDSDSEIST